MSYVDAGVFTVRYEELLGPNCAEVLQRIATRFNVPLRQPLAPVSCRVGWSRVGPPKVTHDVDVVSKRLCEVLSDRFQGYHLSTLFATGGGPKEITTDVRSVPKSRLATVYTRSLGGCTFLGYHMQQNLLA